MRNCQTVIQITCTILYSHHQCIKIPIAPHSCQYLVLCFNLLIFLHSIESVVWCYLIVALIYISLLTNDAEHFFMCLLATCLSWLVKWPFKYFAHFKNWLVFLLSNWKSCLYTLDTSPMHIHVLQILSPNE